MARDELDEEEPGADRAADGLAHLQAAAREVLAAARAMLDVAESLVEDPKAVTALVDSVGSVVREAAKSALAPPPPRRDDDDGYQRIKVS